jgi:uncharacterized membrane protein
MKFNIKSILVICLGCLYGCMIMSIPHFLDSLLKGGPKVVSFKLRELFNS